MANSFLCFCGSSFSNENSLKNHVSINHMKVFKDESHKDIEHVLKCFTDALPEHTIDISSGEGWYTNYKIICYLENTRIEQYLGNTKGSSTYPATIEEALRELKWKIATAEFITKKVNEIGEFHTFYCENFDYNYSLSESSFSFVFKLDEKDELSYSYYYPFNDEQNIIEDYIDSFKQYFVDSVSGYVEIKDDGYSEEFYINGVNIASIFSRGKSVKLEIIE